MRYGLKISICAAQILVLEAAHAQTLYLGDTAVDTADSQALSRVLRHCQELETALSGVKDQTEGELAARPQSQQRHENFNSDIKLNMLASGSDGAEAAGEGSGAGIPTEDDDGQDEPRLVLSEITHEHCKEAGLVN
jgi:hypothetical protein